MKMLIVTFLIGAIILFSQSSFVSAQTTSPACTPSTGACIQTGTPHWEFDAIQNLCYQPLAQCGGTKFATELDCQTACLTNSALTPTVAPTTSISPTTIVTATPAPTEPANTPTPTIEPTPLTTITPTEAPSCSQSKGDANNDGKATLRDFELFRAEYSGEATTFKSDFNCDGKVSLIDYEIFREAFTE